MTRYLLDTNIASDLVRNPQGRAAARVAEVGAGAVFTRVIVAAELRFGCTKNGAMRRTRAIVVVLREIAVPPLDDLVEATHRDSRAR